MRFLGIGDGNDLGAMYLALEAEGHRCRVFIADDEAGDTLGGLVARTRDWREELAWIREAGSDGVVLFETAHDGVTQDALRREGYQVIGGSALGDRLESDRAFGQRILAAAGMQVAATHSFDDVGAAIDFVRRTRVRYVFKLAGGYVSTSNYVGGMADGSDMVAYLAHQGRVLGERISFVLMEHLSGVEIGVGAYFDGEGFLEPACLDWEHKRFFPGDLGELTGEMGTLVTYRDSERLFEATLGRLADVLAASGYVGYVNLNTIVNQGGVWPLELTCRFGYPGFPILSALHRCGWSDIFRSMLARDRREPFPTHDGYAVGVVVTVPPFPYAEGYEELSKGMPVTLVDLTDEDRRHVHLSEVALVGGQLVTAGMIGYILVVTGRGATPEQARAEAYARVAKVYIPNMRYRTDIGVRFVAQDRARLEALGWIGRAR